MVRAANILLAQHEWTADQFNKNTQHWTVFETKTVN